MPDMKNQIQRRRTFAIISHPDAGKTTLTEKFLLYGGAITLAGMVKGKRNSRHAVSDWMEIEKQRGISVTSSVMQFQYDGYCINILDTPGHQDFSEDTYRTLMAADSAVMVIDASKGVEAQTRKLFKVCVMRDIPIFTFINKMDRDSRSPYDLLDEIEKELGIATCPVNWPIGSGKEFKGVFDRQKQEVELFSDTKKGTSVGEVKKIDINNPEIDWLIGTEAKVTLEEEIELLDGAAAEFDQKLVSKGELSPVFFGSALTNFGVETFLQHFLAMTSSPLPRMSDQGPIDPMKEKDFSIEKLSAASRYNQIGDALEQTIQNIKDLKLENVGASIEKMTEDLNDLTSDLEKVADYITFVNNGKIIFSENKDELIYNSGVVKCSEKDIDKILSLENNITLFKIETEIVDGKKYRINKLN